MIALAAFLFVGWVALCALGVCLEVFSESKLLGCLAFVVLLVVGGILAIVFLG